MKTKKILAAAVIFIILFSSGCQDNKELKVLTMDDFEFTELGEGENVIIPKGYIGFSVYGKDNELIIDRVFANSDYKRKISVADLSKDICRELNIPFVFSGMGVLFYVEGINALFERDHGPDSGWLYSVNGEYQGIGCATYILKDGDYVEWHYTLELGRDFGLEFDQ